MYKRQGFTLEELRTEGSHPRCEATDELLSMLDVLVDGRFVAVSYTHLIRSGST